MRRIEQTRLRGLRAGSWRAEARAFSSCPEAGLSCCFDIRFPLSSKHFPLRVVRRGGMEGAAACSACGHRFEPTAGSRRLPAECGRAAAFCKAQYLSFEDQPERTGVMKVQARHTTVLPSEWI